jgi:hypothetical protein
MLHTENHISDEFTSVEKQWRESNKTFKLLLQLHKLNANIVTLRPWRIRNFPRL